MLFNPTSLVIVGASDRHGLLGRGLTLNVLSSLKDPVYPVNVRGGSVLGRSSYRRVSEVPGPADLAPIITPATRLEAALNSRSSQRGMV